MAVERAQVCVIMIDAVEGFTEQDSKVAGIAHELGKACIIAVNKWDAVEKDGKTMDSYRKKLMNDFSFMSYAPIIFISAKRDSGSTDCLSSSNMLTIRTPCVSRPAASTTCSPMPRRASSRRQIRVEDSRYSI